MTASPYWGAKLSRIIAKSPTIAGLRSSIGRQGQFDLSSWRHDLPQRSLLEVAIDRRHRRRLLALPIAGLHHRRAALGLHPHARLPFILIGERLWILLLISFLDDDHLVFPGQGAVVRAESGQSKIPFRVGLSI